MQPRLTRIWKWTCSPHACLAAATLLLGAVSTLAQAPAPKAADQPADKPPDKPPGWENVAQVGLTLTRGNSENFLGTVGLTSTRKWTRDELFLGANAGYGETTDTTKDPETHTTSAQFMKGFGQWNHLYHHHLYSGLRVEGLYDHVAGIDYRVTTSPLAGYYFLKQPQTLLAVELGPSLIAENLADKPAQQYLGFRVGERFEYKFSDRARIWQTAEWVPQVDDLDNWVLTTEVGVSAALTKTLDVRLVLQDRFDNRPAPGREKNDLKLIAGIGYRF